MAGYIGVQPVPKATQRREYFTATNNQTTFNTAGYTPDYVDVYMNGVKLSPADFTATNGSDVVLASGATTGDLLQIISFLPFQAANQAFTGTLSATGVVTANAGVVVDNITIDGNDISTTNTNGNLTITPNGTGDLQVNSDRIKVRATEGESAAIMLAADEQDDAGDSWNIIANTDNTFAIQNDVSGSADVTHFSITPNATVANSTATFAGKGTFANNVGINATSPSADYGTDFALEIKGATSPGLVINDTGQGSKYGIHADSNDIKIIYGTTALAIFQNDGKVGVKDTSPDNQMNIKESALSGRSASNGNTSLTIEHATDTGIQFFSATQTQLRFGDAASTGAGSIIYNHSNQDLKFNTEEALALTLDSSQNATFAGDVSLADNKKATFGGGDDLEIYYDGSDAYIRNHSGGRIIQRARTGFLLQTNATGGGADNAITANQSGSVELTYANVKKFETTNTGVTVTGITTSTGFSGKIHPVSGTTTNYLRLDSSNELNLKNSSDVPQTLHINYTIDGNGAGGNVDLGRSAVQIVNTVTNSEPTVKVKGGGYGYTHGAIALMSDDGSDPRVRGQGIYLFNEENDTTWYVGTPYWNTSAGSRPFDFNFKSSTTSLDAVTAHTDNTKARIHATGLISAPVGIEIGDGIDGTAAHTLDAYEEGSWTLTDQSGAGLSLSVYVATYTKIGNQVFFEFGMVFPTTSDTSDISLSLPFAAITSGDNTGGGSISTTSSGRTGDTVLVVRNTAKLSLSSNVNSSVTNANYSGKQLRVAGQYTVP